MNETAEIVGAARGMIQRYSEEEGPLHTTSLVQVFELIEKLATELDKTHAKISELEKRISHG